MKVIIPAAGHGTRMRPHTHTRPKPLVPVAGRPSLAFVLDALAPLDVEEIIFIVGRMGEQMEQYVKEEYSQYSTRFIEQKVMRGQADAIALAQDFVEGSLLVLFVDTIFETDLTALNSLMEVDGAIFVMPVPDPTRFGVAVVGQDGYVTQILEKSTHPDSNLAAVGLYYFKDARWLFRAIGRCIGAGNSHKGEYYLTHSIQMMIDEGAKFSTLAVSVWEDTGTHEAILHANRYLLGKIDQAKQPYISGTSLIVPPTYISAEATVENSIIGPYVAVSERARITRSIIHNSIISPDATVASTMLFGSIVGERAHVEGTHHTLNIGDDSIASFSGTSDTIIDETFK